MSDSDTYQRTAVSIERSGAGAHVLRFNRGIQQITSVPLTQGELIDLWQKIGAYFNFAGMGELGERAHEHRYNSQVLRHSHDGGNQPHGYFGHEEDYPKDAPAPGELYNGEPLPGTAGHYHDATGHEDTPCTCPSPGTYAPQQAGTQTISTD